MLTGLPDPLCGVTHSLFSLGQGKWLTSLDYAPVGPVVLLAALLAVSRGAWAIVRTERRPWPPSLLSAGAIALALSWAVQILRTVT